MLNRIAAIALFTLALQGAADAQIKIGVTVSATGPAASLGITEKNVFEILPKSIAGEPLQFIVLDDASDTTNAVRNARRFVNEDKVDLLIGSTTTPGSIAISEVAAETKTPMFGMGAGEAIASPVDERRKWVFKAVPNDSLMVEAIIDHMSKNKIKTIGFIGFADATGEGYWKALQAAVEKHGIKVVASERYARTDTSVAPQSLRLTSGNPDAIFIAAFGSPAALPQTTLRERGYKGLIYQTNGVANADFLRLAGKHAEGTVIPVGPLLIAEQLGDESRIKPVAKTIWDAYAAKFGQETRNSFIANAYDAYLLAARAIPIALKTARPGTPEFRSALRDAIEQTKDFVGSNGIYNLTPTDHVGLDLQSIAMITVQNGDWKLLPKQ